ncbi:MAG TPA: efflux RND transporter periplasmic adaptor subunit, partial [Candidatus Accumulibacter phosphatis]|nr:efflux RND transporter periplasmic adaptor subunit [Candidatus Accumulibacter phosphatis]
MSSRKKHVLVLAVAVAGLAGLSTFAYLSFRAPVAPGGQPPSAATQPQVSVATRAAAGVGQP